MQEALDLARGQVGKVWPNPAVGCLIVKEGIVIGRGATQAGGRPHAEAIALNDAGERSKGAMAYVTLEPCDHRGETPPCSEALIRAGISSVLVATGDPDPRVNGKGLERLRKAGVQVEVGLCQEDAQEANAGFFHRVKTGCPLIAIIEEGALETSDLFETAASFDGVLVELNAWLKARPDEGGDRPVFSIVIDDRAIAPAAISAKSAVQREALWLVVGRDRLPSRTQMLRDYVGRVVEVDVDEFGGLDLEALALALGNEGLTRLAVYAGSDLAERLSMAELTA